MEDQIPQILTEKADSVSDNEKIQVNTISVIEDRVLNQIEETTSSEEDQNNESRVCDEIKEVDSSINQKQEVPQSSLMNEDNKASDKEEKDFYPILQKVDTLFSKILDLKKEHMELSNEVKTTSGKTFPGSDVAAALGVLSVEHETLKKKYVEESFERKRLYNEVIELKGNIRVFCRCRPLNQDEIASGTSSVVDIDPSRETELHIVSSDSSKKHFKFDHIFGPEDNQEAVFAQTSPVVISVLDGFNVCIFAYGQTGTGKTFTMEGTPGNRGVNFRTLEELFRISMERSSTMKYELSVSMLEVYNEKIRDLLIENSSQFSKKLEIKQAVEGTQEIPGLIEARVHNTNEVWELLKTGTQNRAVGSTNANEFSSRSHCLFRVTVRGENLVNGQRTKSYLWLVDLAGSERVGRIEVDGERLKESQFINKSLSALGDVISALASKTSHIPYRNSKLTHLLQSSLGGDCKALMFVQISPSNADLGETLCSLNFASRVRGIEHGPARKQADPTEHFKFKQMAEKLKHYEKETKKLEDSLQSLQLKFATREQLCKSQQERVRDLENQLAEERKTRLQQESRAAAAAVAAKSLALSSAQQGQKVQIVGKPPLGPLKPREPLRRITNFLPPPSPVPPQKSGIVLPISRPIVEKENDLETTTKTNNKSLMKPRRVSIAVRPSIEATQANHQPRPKRQRVSIATLRPDAELLSAMKPTVRPQIGRLMARRSIALRPDAQVLSSLNPLNTSTVRPENGGMMARRSFAKDPRRISRIFSPMEELTGEATPSVSGSRFLGSPPGQQQTGSWKPKHPTVVALQKRHFVWSPLKQRIQRNERKSLPPSRLA
ncbi:Kinesin-like protein kin-14s [Thalictrum thalictroides]|uniref:Kinesin-like protein kin-14s n=1 Tax=Thalictrum thalictroides TaxID=46969 RepID=A0A7J6WZ60_THATH|nr:Kinesin-like protein kin-14s [Thalictrum thalictroides]